MYVSLVTCRFRASLSEERFFDFVVLPVFKKKLQLTETYFHGVCNWSYRIIVDYCI